MEAKPAYCIVVEYYADPTQMIDDHDCEPMYLTEIRNRRFNDIFEAIKFLSECNSPITTIDEIVAIGKKPKNFKFILPEQNIKIKHQADNSIDSTFILGEEMDWK